MKKIVGFVKKYWYFLFLVIPFTLICFVNTIPDNDTWFLLNSGRYVSQYGIPHIDPFSMHEGLHIIMHQWGSASIFYFFYNVFGYHGMIVLIWIMIALLFLVLYKLFYYCSKKKFISILGIILVTLFCKYYIVLRPQVFTYIILFTEVYLLERYAREDNVKYLYFLPILSFLQINLHGAMWLFQFVFLLPFIINAIPFKKIKFLKKLRIDKYRLKPLLVVALVMILFGLINPYGIEAFSFIYKSYGSSVVNSLVGEMFPPRFGEGAQGMALFVFPMLVITLLFAVKKGKFDIRHILFILGCSLLAFMHNKCCPYFVIAVVYAVMYYIKDIDFKFDFKILHNQIVVALSNALKVVASLGLVATFGCLLYYSYINYRFVTSDYLEDTYKYLKDNTDISKVTLFNNYEDGSYMEFMGIKSYIDPRAEVFLKKHNGKDDILEEFVDVYKKPNGDFKSFINKYKFTHILVFDGEDFDDYLKTENDYKLVFEYKNTETDEVVSRLYERKDFNNL